MNINIVTVNSGWILQKIAERTAKFCSREGVQFSVTPNPIRGSNPNADANFYVDLQNCYFGSKTKLDVAYFTHAHEDSKDWLFNLFNERKAFLLDGIISMNKRYTDMIIDIGYPSNKITTLTPGQTHDSFPLKKIKIGIVSRGEHEGYGKETLEKLFQQFNVSNFEFHFLGKGWSSLTDIANLKGISVFFDETENYSVYPDFYKKIDYLLIPTLWTAGPMSMQEALSTGIPIISANVGFTNYEFSADYVYSPPRNVHGLHSILSEIESPILKRRAQVENMTWEKYSNSVVGFINHCKALKG